MAPPLTCCPPVPNESILGEEFFFWGWYCKKGRLITFYTIPPPIYLLSPRWASFFYKSAYFGGGIVILGGALYKRSPYNLLYYSSPNCKSLPPWPKHLYGGGIVILGVASYKSSPYNLLYNAPPFSCCPPMVHLIFLTTPTLETFLFWGGHCKKGYLITCYTIPPPCSIVAICNLTWVLMCEVTKWPHISQPNVMVTNCYYGAWGRNSITFGPKSRLG